MSTKTWMPDIDHTMTGRAWRFEGVLDVDWELCPWQAAKALSHQKLTYAERMEAMKPLAMQPLDPDFHKKAQRGDFLIGGRETGYGHDHDQAIVALRAVGIAAVLCEGSNMTFIRNSINNGLPVIVTKGIMDGVKTGDTLEVNLVEGFVNNTTTHARFSFKPWAKFILDIMRDGGLYPWTREDRQTKQDTGLAPAAGVVARH